MDSNRKQYIIKLKFCKYSNPCKLDFDKTRWFPYIPVPDDTNTPFDLRPITPKQVKSILASKQATSLPGPDGLIYGLLKNIPATHHFLATLFTQFLLESPDPPESWSESRVSLIYKAGDNTLPENFLMISLTSCVSKLYHQI